ncbi:hypothetical protein ABNX05_11900 [Lysinibacillus sp. M3]|uniref:Uncharacterized protein n=1 Tax=Lysinibacillus zambalensis TaxID=3160866 RepID=A0ABV1MVP6_9BACI
MTEKKQIMLTPDVFKVNNDGEVIINNSQLVEEIERATDEIAAGEQGVVISISVSV